MTKIQGTGFESLSISWPIVTYFEISLSLAHQVNVYSHLRKKRNK
ncbi:hypothetical protein [Limosilactobacillus gastricus]|nr:hypothetical protein [Limosilactobacillus gastricus]